MRNRVVTHSPAYTAQEIGFNAGTHADAFRMPFEDYRRLEAPIVLRFSGEPASAGG